VNKLNRNCLLSIQKAGEPSFLNLERPFTVEFDVTQNTMAAVTDSNFRIYNLAETTRAQLRQDAYGYGQDSYGQFRFMSFAAGYGDNLSNLFSGNLLQAWSVRQGPDWITTVVAQDYGAANVHAQFKQAYSAGTPVQAIILDLIDALRPYGISRGTVSQFDGTLVRGNTYCGNPADLLREITGGAFFVSNGRAYCLRDNEAFQGELPVLSPASGLRNTPVRENSFVHLEMILEPRLKVGQIVKLESLTGEGMNGEWKVVSLRHQGVISETAGGEATTSVGLMSATAGLALVI
jgi:hypothetical protein